MTTYKTIPSTIPLLAMLLVAAWPLDSRGATFCVATGNQLAAALSSATSNAESDEIKIEYGTLTSDVQAPKNYQWIFDGRGEEYATTISGGWTKSNGCASIATNDPAATVLDGQYWGPVFLADLRYDFSGTFTIKNLTFARGKLFNTACISGNVGITCASGLGIEAWALPGAAVTVDNVLVRSGVSESGVIRGIVALVMTGGGTLKLRNSIVMGNDLSAGAGTEGVRVNVSNNTIAYLNNNSIFGNTVRSDSVGLEVTGVATLANNAVADNATTGPDTAYQFIANNVSTMTLRNNHFGTRRYAGGGFPFLEVSTTTGDAEWTQTGYKMVPDTESVLRDSGQNAPSGGLPTIDFSGYARIQNAVIDRGAVEAEPPPTIGPAVTPSSPVSGSTTMVVGTAGSIALRWIAFSASGGTLGGTTQLLCDFIAGSGTILGNASQTVTTGAGAGQVSLSLPVTSTLQDHTVMCTADRQNGGIQSFFMHYRVGPDVIMTDGFESSP
ncbi:MAG: hypothetical protein HYV17_12915 [Xanthomonadales bacterium]|nr:hypothetical protein [Xanthomonadales bacterium]